MKLRILEGQLCKSIMPDTYWYPSRSFYPSGGWQRVETLAKADGLWFLCPKCFAENGGKVGTHSVLVPFSNAPPGSYPMRNAAGEEPRWNATGTTLDDLVVTPSVQLLGSGCQWHGFVGSSGVPPGEAQ